MASTDTRIVRDVTDEFLSATCTNRRALLTIKERQSRSPWLPGFVSLVFLMLACLALPQQAAAQSAFNYGDTRVTISNAVAYEGNTASFRLSVRPEIF